jgi:hypothetical protein
VEAKMKMKTGLALGVCNGSTWVTAARRAALVAAVAFTTTAIGGGACATPNSTDFGSGGSGSTASHGAGSSTQSGGAAGSHSAGAFVTTGAGGGDSTGNGGVGGACASSHHEGELTPLDIYIMFDRSDSMAGDNKWVNCTNALKTFVQSPEAAGIGVGLQYFPLQGTIPSACQMCMNCACVFDCGCSGCGSTCMNGVCTSTCTSFISCQPADYGTAAVEIAPLPGNATAIINSIDSMTLEQSTPTRPALEGALTHARDWALAHPGHKVVVVLATDGEPSGGCPLNGIFDAKVIAQLYFSGTPSIPTYVIGVGSSLGSLYVIAQSGGTNMAYIVDGGPNTTQQFLDAMNAIRKSAGLACEYQIPAANDGGVIDFDKVNVQYIPGNGGPPADVLRAQSAADCDPVQGGWYYDNNAAPTKILICPATCMTIEADDMGKIDILFGCPTVNLPPH